ncbi:MAG: hypothetical protein QE263_05185 [Vampirovibrionales bacterium]|nr:hypothetical protein [Vampirovibrionales bacterium]
MNLGARTQPIQGLPRVLKFGEGQKKEFSEERYQNDPAIVQAKVGLEEEKTRPPGIDPDDPITAKLLEEMEKDKRLGSHRYRHDKL